MRALSLKSAVLIALLLVLPSCAFMGYTAKDVSFTDRPVAKLLHQEGTVLVKTQGKWGALPETGMPLYSEDKVVTFNGAATIEFYDAQRIGICKNTNLQITQQIQKWVPFRTYRELDRGVVLLMGKMYFRTGKEKVLTHFITPTLVFSLFYGKGNLSLDSDENSYILLEKGMTTFKVGEYKYGIADLPSDVSADSSPVMQAALNADVAATQARLALDEVAAGRMSQAQADWYQAQAAEASAQEELACAELIELYNPERVVYTWSKKAVKQDKKKIKLAQEDKERAVAAGAVAPSKEQPAEQAPAAEAPAAEAPAESVEEKPLPEGAPAEAAPAEAAPAEPAPAAPAPVAPSYTQPVAPSYSQPVAPSYVTPVAPSYVTPAQPEAAPAQPEAAPAQPEAAPE
ncbi:MAG: hypothetical protein AB1921_16445, partial [Thermodesulfobacteriota bacterium]